MSAIHSSPYVNFQGHAREAMEFYHAALGGAIDLQTVDEQGAARPTGPEDRVTYARLDADGALIIGSDGHPNYPPTAGDNIAIALGGADKDRLIRIFNTLAEGGYIKGALTAQPWGGSAGWLMDKFGVNWVISIEKA